MKNPVYMTLLSTLVGVLAMYCTTSGSTQDASPFPQSDARPVVTYVQDADPVTGVVRRFPKATTVRSKSGELRSLMKQYKEADRDEKEDLETQIRDMLEEQYDAFLAQNEKQIDQLQERLNKLKDQLDRRRRAKSKLVDLEFERMANEAEGLIWPDRQFGGMTVWGSRSAPSPVETLPFMVPESPAAASPPRADGRGRATRPGGSRGGGRGLPPGAAR